MTSDSFQNRLLHSEARLQMRLWLRQRAAEKRDGDHLRPGHSCRDQIADTAGVEGILAAVDTKYLTDKSLVPRWINRRRLRVDINYCAEAFHRDCILNDPNLGRQRVQRLHQYSRLASDLLQRLNDGAADLAFDLAARALSPIGPLGRGPSRSGLKRELEGLASFADAELARGIRDGPVARSRHAPPVLLIGIYFVDVYERWFRREAGISRDKYGQASGPFIRFAEAALADLGIHSTHGAPYGRETISIYFRQARSSETNS